MSAASVAARRGSLPANPSGIGKHGQRVLGVLAAAVLLVLVAPMLVVVVVSFSSSDFVIFPPPGFGLKWYGTFVHTPDFVSAFLMSAEVALAASIAATVLGVPASYVLVRRNFRGRRLLSAVFLSPLMVPQIVIGVGLLQFYAWLGLSNSLAGLVAAHTVVVLPYVVRTVGAALLGLSPQVEEAAADLGADTITTLALVVVPIIKGGVLSGALFAMIMSWINVEVSIFLSATGTYTLPVLIYNYTEYSLTPLVIVAAALSMLASALLVLIIDRCVGLSSAMRL